MGKRQRTQRNGDGGQRRRQQNPRRQRQPESQGSNQSNQELLRTESDPQTTVLQQAAEQSDGTTSEHRPESGDLADVYDNQTERNATLTGDLGSRSGDLQTFVDHWNEHKARYEAVAAKVDMPAELIAAIHWRESSGNFNTYLHQGDPLGKAAVHVPTDIPIFHDWESAAEHAINMKSGNQDALSITEETDDAAALGTYAEAYNGLGYHKYHSDVPSPYVYAGTSAYESGKYVADGKFDGSHTDQQLGVLAMMDAVGGIDLGLVEDEELSTPAVAASDAETGVQAPTTETPQRRRRQGGLGRRTGNGNGNRRRRN